MRELLRAIVRRSIVAGLLAGGLVPGTGCGQVLLYQETFPYPGLSGNFPLSAAGWANDVLNNPARLYQVSGGDGAVFAYQNTPLTTAFYTSTALSPTAGAAFPAI